MLTKLIAASAAVALFAGVALADGTAKPAKLTDVNVCPMTMEKVKGAGAGSEVFETYRVHFCCGGCQPNFDKLSKVEKEKKVADALKKS